MALKGAPAPKDPNLPDSDEDTKRPTNQSPVFKPLPKEEELNLLLAPVVPALALLPDHALDLAADNSKIVVVRKTDVAGVQAVLATPDGPVLLPDNDPAHKLPEGTRVFRVASGRFEAKLPPEYQEHTQPVASRAAELIAAINASIRPVSVVSE